MAASPFLKVHADSASSWLAQHEDSQEIRASGLSFGSHDEETHRSLSPGEWFAMKIIFFCCFYFLF